MTREEAIYKLRILQEMRDKEIAHCNADDVICDLLKSLGYEDVVRSMTLSISGMHRSNHGITQPHTR